MTLPESKDLILKYIEEHDGKKIKQDVVDYMNSEEVPEDFRISRVPTPNLIKELQSENRIIVKGKRRGQSHYLMINDKSLFDEIKQNLSILENKIDKIIESPNSRILKNFSYRLEGEKDQMYILWDLARLLAQTNQYINNEGDKRALINKIIELELSVVKE